MNIKELALDKITPYESNPRKNDEAVPAVAKSIQSFGFKVPIVIDKGGVIVCGHTRYKAAMELGMDKVPCVIADDLTPEQIKAFRLADNKTAEIAEWDNGLLDKELADLQAIMANGILDFSMEDFGFDLDALVGSLGEDATQRIEAGGEINAADFGDDKFSCTCPKCGFKFNPKE